MRGSALSISNRSTPASGGAARGLHLSVQQRGPDADQSTGLQRRDVLTVDQSIAADRAALLASARLPKDSLSRQHAARRSRGCGASIRGTADGYLDRGHMGKKARCVEAQDRGRRQEPISSMPPLIVGELVIYGPAGADWGAKTWISAFSWERRGGLGASIGRRRARGCESWTNAQAREHGGQRVDAVVVRRRKGRHLVPVGTAPPDL